MRRARDYRGGGSAWFRGAEVSHEGHIRAGGVDKDVTFVDVDRGLDGPIDAAYRAKYRRYQASIIDSIVSPQARAATIRLLPNSR